MQGSTVVKQSNFINIYILYSMKHQSPKCKTYMEVNNYV